MYFAGEITRQKLNFPCARDLRPSPVLYASLNNPGAVDAASLIVAALPPLSVHTNITSTPPFAQVHGGSGDSGTHFLLYLSHATFVGEPGEGLAEEVRKARKSGFPMVLLHENDMDNGGCEFSRFFETTPQDLIADGLYSALATAFYPEPFQSVSIALIGGLIGGTKDLVTCRGHYYHHVTGAARRLTGLDGGRSTPAVTLSKDTLTGHMRGGEGAVPGYVVAPMELDGIAVMPIHSQCSVSKKACS